MTHKILCSCLFLCFYSSLNAQSIIGKLTNNAGEPIPYAHIILEGTGTISNDSNRL